MEKEDHSSSSEQLDEDSIGSKDFEMEEEKIEDDQESIGSIDSLEEESDSEEKIVDEKKLENEIDQELKKAKDTKFSNDIWRSMISLYSKNFYFMDKVNKMPQGNMVDFFENSSEKICEENFKSKMEMMNFIEDLTKLREGLVGGESEFSKYYQNLFLKSKLKKKNSKIRKSKFDCEKAFEALESEFTQRQKYWEEESEKWFTKTSLDILEKDKTLLNKIKHFNQPPYTVSRNMMHNTSKILKKLNRKNGLYRVLGKRKRDNEISEDPEIFEERDLANDLLHELMSTGIDLGDVNEEGIAIDNTARYLQEKRLRRKTKNIVDRRASKHRKIRYGIHDKLINFMGGYENLEEIEGREDLVNNLFGISRKKLKQQDDDVEEDKEEENDIELF